MKNMQVLLLAAALFLGVAGCQVQQPVETPPTDPPPAEQPTEPPEEQPSQPPEEQPPQTPPENEPQPEPIYLGPREVAPTPLERGTLFAAPNGTGPYCMQAKPCSLRTAFGKLEPGSVLFLRGGVYPVRETGLHSGALAGTAEQPVIIESYPGEWAVLEGEYSDAASYEGEHHFYYGIRIDKDADYVYIRRLEVRYMGNAGIGIRGSHNLVEGCELHHNTLSGVELYGGEWHEDDPDFKVPYPEGYNTVRDNVIHDNSDVYLATKGDSADGVAISSGRFNRAIHNRVYGNSDDGIDTWRSNDSYVAFNLVYDNGRGERGNGNGIKAGGNLDPDAKSGWRAQVVHNLAYGNRARGFDYNSGKDVLFACNTAYQNETYGFLGGSDTRIVRNISLENGVQASGGIQQNNSWQTADAPEFVSRDPASPDFLRPVAGNALENMGAYATVAEDCPVLEETAP